MEDNKDSDLTMLKQEPTPVEKSYEDMIANAKSGGSLLPITDESSYNKAVTKIQADQLVNSSVRDGSVDTKLDVGQLPGENINTTRARNQSTAIKGIKAIGGGLYQGSLIALEQLGYVADMDTYTNLFTDVEDVSGNWWTKLMREAQDAGRESDMLKIYEDAPDDNNFMSQIFKWQSLEGAVSSALGFGITGLGAASVVSKLGSLKKFKYLAGLTDTVMGNIKGEAAITSALKAGKGLDVAVLRGQAAARKMVGATQAFTGPLASSMMANYYMGQLMATDTFEQTMEALRSSNKIGDGEGQISEFEAQKIANENAQEVVGLNMALTATAYLKFGGIFKRANKASSLLKDPTALRQLKDLIIKGSPTAFTENVYQEMIQMEQIYDTKREFNIASEYSDDYWDRMSQLALSNRAVHAGALGIVGGPIQFAIIQKPLMKKQFSQQKENFEKQQSHLNFRDTLRETDFKAFKEFDTAYKKALLSGTKEDMSIAEDMHIIHELTKQVEWGTLDYLKKSMEDAKNMTEEERLQDPSAKDWDENYRDTVTGVIELINKSEEIIGDYAGVENLGEVLFNSLMVDRVKASKDVTRVARKAMADTISKDLFDEYGIELSPTELLRKGFKLSRDRNRFEGLDERAKRELIKQEQEQDMNLADYMDSSPYTADFNKLESSYKRYSKLSKDLVANRKKILSREYQINYAKEQLSRKNNIDKLQDNLNKEQEDLSTQEAVKTESTFSVEKNKAPVESKEDREARLKNWKSDTKGLSTIRSNTFTSSDKFGEKREFTPGDLKRAVDGRYYSVRGQSGATKSKGALKYTSMPTIIETDSRGYIKKGAKAFTPDDHSFLMPEARQLVASGKKGTRVWRKYADTWAPYIKPDSDLRPNFLTGKIVQQNRAEAGEVITVNNWEYKTNKPTGQLEKTEFAKEYAVHELNEPFKNPYRVEYKLRHTGKEGQTFIDIYKLRDDGTSYKLTMLDRQSNLNFKAIEIALTKGPVFGTVVEHYSSSRNIVVLRDEQGNKIYNSVAEFLKGSKSNLINGKVWIASKNNESVSNTIKHYAVAYDGKEAVGDSDISSDGTIKVMIDGVEHIKSIPFDSKNWRVGDTYALVLSPNNNITPIALSSLQVKDLPSNMDNKSLADDIIAMHTAQTREYFESIVDDLSSIENPTVDKGVEGGEMIQGEGDIDNSLRDSEKAYANKNELRKLVRDNVAGYSEHLKKGVSKIIRSTWKKAYIKKDGEYKDVYVNGKPAVREDYFALVAAVDSNGNVVPAVAVGEQQRAVYYNITDNFDTYKYLIEERRRTFDIEDFANPVQKLSTGEVVNVIKQAIENGELITDANPTQIFAGSSATIQTIGEDIQAEGYKVAQESRKYYGTRFSEKLQEVSDEAIEDILEEFDKDFNDVLEDTPVDSSTTDFLADLTNLFTHLDITNRKELSKLISEGFSEDGIEGTSQDYDKILAEVDPDGTNPLSSIRAKAVILQSIIFKKIQAKEYTVKIVDSSNLLSDPAKFRAQKENIIFGKSSAAYHKVYGNGVITTSLRDGYYYMKVDSTGVNRKVWAKDIFEKNGQFVKLFKLQDQLKDAITSNNTALVAIKERAVLNQENYMASKGLIEGSKSDVESKNIAETEETVNTENASYDVEFDLVNVMADYVSPFIEDKIKKFKKTDRTMSIQSSFINLNEAKGRYLKLSENDQLHSLTDEEVSEVVGTAIKSTPYTTKELTNLISISELKIEKAVTPAQKDFFEKLKFKLEKAKSVLSSVVSHTAGSPLFTISKLETSKSTVKNYDDAVLFLGKLETVAGNAVIAESELKAGFFNTQEITKKVVTPKTDVKKSVTASNPETKTVKDIPTTVQPIKTKSKVDNIIRTRIPSAPTEIKNNLITKYSEMLKVDDEARVLRILDIELKRLNLKHPTKKVPVSSDTNTENSDNVGKKLTLEYNHSFTFRGNKFDSIEHAYRTWESGEFDQVAFDNDNDVSSKMPGDASTKVEIMESILKDRFREDSALTDKIFSLGGKEFLLTIADNTGDKFWGDGKYTKSLAKAYEYHDVPFRLGEDLTLSDKEFEAEVKEAKKMLPKVPINIIESLASMQNRFGEKALGAYDRGVRFLVQGAKRGTAYHETMHAVAGLYLTSIEKQEIAEEYGAAKWDINVDEKLAEDFTVYATEYFKAKSSPADNLISKVRKFFKSIFDYVFNTRSFDVTKSVFEKTITGGYANSNSITYLSNVASNELRTKDIESFTSSLSEKENVTLQSLVENKRIKIKC